MSQTSNNYTVLDNRILFYDGDSIAKNDAIVEMMLSGIDVNDAGIYFAENNQDNTKFIKKFPKVMGYKNELKPYDTSWNLPAKYESMDVYKYIISLLVKETKGMSAIDKKARENRTIEELSLWEDNDMFPLLKCLIHVIDEFRENEIVWGTGRGSSCCCYILYLIGVHDVDSILYDLDLSEFFRDQ